MNHMKKLPPYKYGKRKRVTLFKIFFIVFLPYFCYQEKVAKPTKQIELTAKAHYILDLQTHKVLFEKNANTQFSAASTIKLFTAFYSKELFQNKQWILIPKEATILHPLASKAGLQKGEYYTYIDLFYAMLIASANDASIAIAIFANGKESTFANSMTHWMHKKKFLNSRAFDSTGISPQTITSASDLGQLLAEISKLSDFYETVFLANATIVSQTGRQIYLTNRNKLATYKNFQIGGKTGNIKKAGQCFAGFIKNQNALYAVAILGSTSYVEDLKRLMDNL
ncbi:MAG: D-alanyl-D-alanine carboxypeptidase [Leptospiraceae bacterium]|nr:D-alanyl-D-alanine carboxypeptidase [Leptospiraceae bacterium]MCP5494175.1 D-alanyl-D-alanine carboxypeptidase [Leptospiraceae bacterium]